MPGNPLVPQGTLNRLRGSVIFADFPSLNVTAAFLAREAIGIAFQDDAAQLIPTLTGGVTSDEPYQLGVITIHLLKTQALADRFKKQVEANSTIGAVSVRTDTGTLSDYDFLNCVLSGPRDLPMDGNQPQFAVTVKGIYNVNSALWGA